MKRSVLLAIAAVVLLASPRAGAVGLVSESHIQVIRDRCRSAQQAMQTTHNADAVLRHNLLPQYDTLISKLMAPLNSRISLNKLDATPLVSTTTELQAQVDNIRIQYISYEKKLSEAIDIDCASRPLDFYQALAVARDERRAIGSTIIGANDLIKKYRDSAESFAAKIPGGRS